MVFEGGWTRVQGFGTSEILRRIEFSPPPPQRLGGQQLVKRLEAWWVQVRRIADGWMGGNSSGSQRQERPRANCCPESFSSLCFVSLLLSSCLSWRIFRSIFRNIFHMQIRHCRGLQVSPTLPSIDSLLQSPIERFAMHRSEPLEGKSIAARTMIRFRRLALCITWATCQHSFSVLIDCWNCWKLVGFNDFEDFQRKRFHGVIIAGTDLQRTHFHEDRFSQQEPPAKSRQAR